MTLIKSSFPEYIVVTLLKRYCNGNMLSSHRTINVPIFMLISEECVHFRRCWSWVKYSLDHLFQKCFHC